VAPFLSIYTPTYRRPTLLAACRQSVADQTIAGEIQHYVLVDDIGVGIAGMFAEIPRHVGELQGEYVYVLQDDDVLAGPEVVERLKRFVKEEGEPPVVMVRNRKRGMVLPTFWGEAPRPAHVDLGNYVLRRDVFRLHAGDFGRCYEGDYYFILRVWEMGWRFTWLDLLFSKAMALGLGRPEREMEGEVDKG